MVKDHIIIKKLKHNNYELYKYFEKALEIISVLNDKSYEAYIVGGAVRDILLDKDFNDIDITTNATPQVLMRLFAEYKIDCEYEHLGSITLYIDEYKFELTTFRHEEYVKHRIKDVHYSKRLADDVIRRDFTINALAFPLNLELIDLVDGKKDLEHKKIRIIGKGKQRFKDDPSRILRAFHLVAKLNFKIEFKTIISMMKSRKLLKDLSNFKITTLIKKILNEKYSLKTLRLMNRSNIFKEMPEYANWVKVIIKNHKLNYIEKFAILYKTIGEIPVNNGFSHAENLEIKKIFELIDFVSNTEIDGMDIIQLGLDNLIQADTLAKVINKDYVLQGKNIKKLYKSLSIHSVRELKISVSEIKVLLGEDSSLKIGDVINDLLQLVVINVIENKYSDLEKAVRLMAEGKTVNFSAESKINYDTEPAEENERILSLLGSVIDNKGKEGTIEDAVFEEHQMIEDEFSNRKVVDVDISENVYDDSIIPSEDNNSVDYNNVINEYENINNDNNDDSSLIEMYWDDYKELYKIHRKNVFDEIPLSALNEETIAKYEDRVKREVKQILVENNIKYQDLNNRGKI